MKSFLFAALFLIILSAPVKAAQFSSDYLLQICSVNKDGKEFVKGGHAACQSYIAGILDYHTLIRSLGTAPSVDFCIPEGTSLKEIHKKVAVYLASNHHEQGPFVAAPGVALAVFKAYPCKK